MAHAWYWLSVIGSGIAAIGGWLRRFVLYVGQPDRINAVADLLSAVAALLWPIALVGLVYAFRPEVKRLLWRLKKARLFGQEVELDLNEELVQFRLSADAAADAVQVTAASTIVKAPAASGTFR